MKRSNPRFKLLYATIRKSNIYNWNAEAFRDERILFTKSEVELMEKTKKYKNICGPKGKFLVLFLDKVFIVEMVLKANWC